MAEWISVEDRSQFPAFGEPCFVRTPDGMTIAAASRGANGKVKWHRVGSELSHTESMGWLVGSHTGHWQVYPTHYMRFRSS